MLVFAHLLLEISIQLFFFPFLFSSYCCSVDRCVALLLLLLWVFHSSNNRWFSLNFEWQQVSSTLLDSFKFSYWSAMLWFGLHQLFFGFLVPPIQFSWLLRINPSHMILIGITINFIFHYVVFSSLTRPRYFWSFRFSLFNICNVL